MIADYGALNDKSPHILADLLEIKCLNESRPIARGDIETIVGLDGGHNLQRELRIEEKAVNTGSSAEQNARVQRLSEDVFSHLSYRARAFQKWYPFTVNADVIETSAALSDRQKIYALLLSCSRLKMFSQSARSVLASRFEALSVEALKGLCFGWDVIHFGMNGKDRPRFGTKLKVAIAKLASQLKDTALPIEIDAIPDNDHGDGGIDIVIANTLGDDAQGCPCYLVQCAARQDTWPEKKLEAHSLGNIGRWIHFFHNPGTFLAIPLCYRGPDGKWVDTIAFSTVLFDRLRLIKLLDARKPALDEIKKAVSGELDIILGAKNAAKAKKGKKRLKHAKRRSPKTKKRKKKI